MRPETWFVRNFKTSRAAILKNIFKSLGFFCVLALGPAVTPPPTPKPSINDEDFEDCTSCWRNEKRGHDQFDWVIGRGETASLNTGPSYDHTKKTIFGRYLYIDVSAAKNISGWAHADLESRLLTNVQRRCYLTLWYHMYGQGVGSLAIVAYVYPDPANQHGKYQHMVKRVRLAQCSLLRDGFDPRLVGGL